MPEIISKQVNSKGPSTKSSLLNSDICLILRLLIFLMLFSASTTAQVVYKGRVISQKTKENIPYASVGLIKENTGSNANEQGIFQFIAADPRDGDTLIASCIGYETVKIPVVTGITEYTFELPVKPSILQTVVVSNKQTWETAVLNDFKIKKVIHYITQYYVLQIARRFTAPTEYSVLKHVRIYSLGRKSIFRLRVYDFDPVTQSPSADLCSTIIEVETGRSNEINIDLEKYNIVIPGKDFCVAIEWLKIPENFVHEQKNTAFNDYYKPTIYLLSIDATDSNWFMDYSNVWRKAKFLDIAISATVKY